MCPIWKIIAPTVVNPSEESRPTPGHKIKIFWSEDNLIDDHWHTTSYESVSFYCHRFRKCSISRDCVLLHLQSFLRTKICTALYQLKLYATIYNERLCIVTCMNEYRPIQTPPMVTHTRDNTAGTVNPSYTLLHWAGQSKHIQHKVGQKNT
jgi:hypothetical protein